MKQWSYLFILCIICICQSSCDKDDWRNDIDFTSEWIVASEKRMYNMSPSPKKHPYYVSCYLIKNLDKNTDWYYDDCEIIGFKYEEGYEYQLKVAIMKVDPILSDSSAEIRLLRVLSKEKKESERLPEKEELP